MICLLKFDFFCFVGVTMQVRASAPAPAPRLADARPGSC
jgi:hypothetical protein